MLGEIIKQKRKGLGLTQLDLAEKIDVSILKLATWEADEELPTDEQFILLSKALECPITELTDKKIEVEEPKVVEETPVEEETKIVEETSVEEETKVVEEAPVEQAPVVEEPKATPKEEKKPSKKAPTIIKPVVEDDSNVCRQCHKKIRSESDMVTCQITPGTRLLLCKQCATLVEDSVNRKIDEKRYSEIIAPRFRGLLIQGIIMAIAILISMICFINKATVPGIITLCVAYSVSSFIVMLLLENVGIIKSWKGLVDFSNNEEFEYREKHPFAGQRATPSSSMVIITFPFVFVISVLIYPISLGINFYYGDLTRFTNKRGLMIRKNYYYSIEKNYRKYKYTSEAKLLHKFL